MKKILGLVMCLSVVYGCGSVDSSDVASEAEMSIRTELAIGSSISTVNDSLPETGPLLGLEFTIQSSGLDINFTDEEISLKFNDQIVPLYKSAGKGMFGVDSVDYYVSGGDDIWKELLNTSGERHIVLEVLHKSRKRSFAISLPQLTVEVNESILAAFKPAVDDITLTWPEGSNVDYIDLTNSEAPDSDCDRTVIQYDLPLSPFVIPAGTVSNCSSTNHYWIRVMANHMIKAELDGFIYEQNDVQETNFYDFLYISVDSDN